MTHPYPHLITNTIAIAIAISISVSISITLPADQDHGSGWVIPGRRASDPAGFRSKGCEGNCRGDARVGRMDKSQKAGQIYRLTRGDDEGNCV
jgi:hypothetical protein